MKTIASLLCSLLGIHAALDVAAAPIITANKDDNLAAGLRKLPGNTITYTTTISNTGDATATAVQFSDPDPANTTFVSVNSTPLARADSYSAIGNVQITIAAASGVLANDNDPDDSVNGVGTLTASAGATSTNGGNVSMSSNGGFTYNPAPGYTGNDTFTYTLTDSEGSTDTGTVTINVTGTIWFVQSGGAAGDGRLTTPFNSLPAFIASPLDEAGDNIFLFSGSYSGNLTLLNNQRLIGAGATSSLQTITGLVPSAGSLALPATGGARPTISAGASIAVSLGSGNNVQGLNVTNVNGAGISGGSVGALTMADFDVTTTNGTALSVGSGGSIQVTGTDNDLSATTGTALNVSNVTINAAGVTFKSISSSGATSGIIVNATGTSGSFTITGNGAAGTGGTILNSTSDSVVLTGTNSPSLNWFNITDSAGTAADDGIVMTNITGTVTVDRCVITSVPHNGMTVDNFNTNMAAFNFTNSTIQCSAGAPCQPSGSIGNDGLLLVMRGTSVLTSGVISGSTFSGVRAVGVQIQTNDSGRIGVNSGTVTTTTLTTANSITVQSNTFTGNGQGIDIGTSQVSNLSFQVLNNSIVGKVTAPGAISNQSSATAINAFTAAGADTGPTSHAFVGKIDTNIIGTQGVKDSGAGFGNGIRAVIQGVATQSAITINNNTIREVPNATLINIFAQNGAATTGFGSARFKITNNTMPQPTGSNLGLCGPANTACADSGIFMLADENGIGQALITGNTIYDLSLMNGSFDIYLAQRDGPPANALLRIEGTGSVSSYIQTNNTLTGAAKFIDEGAGSGNPSTLVAIGSAGTYPLLFAPGGVAPAVPDLADYNARLLASKNCPCGCKRAWAVQGQAAPTAEVGSVEMSAPNSAASAIAWTEKVRAAAAESSPASAAPATPSVLTQAALDAVVADARARWAVTGLSDAQRAALDAVKFDVADLPGWYLGEANGAVIRVDRDAGGNGWWIDAMANEDREASANGAPSYQPGATPQESTDEAASAESAIHRTGHRLESPLQGSSVGGYSSWGVAPGWYEDAPLALREGAARDRIDLLTTILHEMGHALGLDDTYSEKDRDNLMYGFLTKGERRLPTKGQAAGATPHTDGATHFLGTPLNIGDLPAGKTVTITYIVQINAGTTAISTSIQGTVSGTNIANKLTNDPQTGAADDATITPIHQPPVVSNVAVSTNEDTTLTFAAGNFTPGSYSDPNGDPIASVIVTSLPANGVLKNGGVTIAATPVVFAIANIGNLTYVPNGNYNGADSFTWNASDGTLTAVAVATVNLTINAVNDVPSFGKGADQTVLEDAGAQTVPGWATAISVGPANEAGQVVNFIVGNNNPALFSVQPAVAANGTLTYTPAANANGTATVTVQIHDNGGTANGGVDTSVAQSFLIIVTAVNDAPSFTKGADQTVNEDAGPQTVPGWATALSPGPADEGGQPLNFIVTSNNNPALFTAQPAISTFGTLTYTPAANASGSATLTVQIRDTGGTANGGVDTSVPQSFLITVNAVNDVPSFTKGADQTVLEDAGAQTVPGWATAISVGPANEAGQVVNFIVGNNNPALFSLQPAIAANGTLTYTPAANANGVANVTVQIHDNGGTANGGVDTSTPQAFTISVTAVNDAPSITAQPAAIALAQGHARTVVFTDVTVSDPDNPYPTGFTLTVQNGANYTRVGATITPTAGFVGTLSVPVQVNDSAANSNVFNLTVTVNPNAEQVATNATIAPEPGGGFRVSFLGAPGNVYTIQFSGSLAPVNWQTLGTVAAAANGRYSMADIPPANTPMRFYRSIEPYLNDFGNGLGAATLRGTAVLTNSAVKLTDEVTGGLGAVTFDSIVAGPTLSGFTARFNLALGPGTVPPADGASFAVGNLGAGAWGETGPVTANSLAVGFDTYDNGSADGNIGIHVWVNGAHLAVNATNPYTNGATVPVEIIYDTASGLTVRYNSVLTFTNLPIPGFTFPAVGGGFGIGARTGGSLERAVVDDVEITPR